MGRIQRPWSRAISRLLSNQVPTWIQRHEHHHQSKAEQSNLIIDYIIHFASEQHAWTNCTRNIVNYYQSVSKTVELSCARGKQKLAFVFLWLFWRQHGRENAEYNKQTFPPYWEAQKRGFCHSAFPPFQVFFCFSVKRNETKLLTYSSCSSGLSHIHTYSAFFFSLAPEPKLQLKWRKRY